MPESLDHRLFVRLAAPPDLAGNLLLGATFLAQSAILAGPALLAIFGSGRPN